MGRMGNCSTESQTRPYGPFKRVLDPFQLYASLAK